MTKFPRLTNIIVVFNDIELRIDSVATAEIHKTKLTL
jgi:hypothetical protein